MPVVLAIRFSYKVRHYRFRHSNVNEAALICVILAAVFCPARRSRPSSPQNGNHPGVLQNATTLQSSMTQLRPTNFVCLEGVESGCRSRAVWVSVWESCNVWWAACVFFETVMTVSSTTWPSRIIAPSGFCNYGGDLPSYGTPCCGRRAPAQVRTNITQVVLLPAATVPLVQPLNAASEPCCACMWLFGCCRA